MIEPLESDGVDAVFQKNVSGIGAKAPEGGVCGKLHALRGGGRRLVALKEIGIQRWRRRPWLIGFEGNRCDSGGCSDEVLPGKNGMEAEGASLCADGREPVGEEGRGRGKRAEKAFAEDCFRMFPEGIDGKRSRWDFARSIIGEGLFKGSGVVAGLPGRPDQVSGECGKRLAGAQSQSREDMGERQGGIGAEAVSLGTGSDENRGMWGCRTGWRGGIEAKEERAVGAGKDTGGGGIVRKRSEQEDPSIGPQDEGKGKDEIIGQVGDVSAPDSEISLWRLAESGNSIGVGEFSEMDVRPVQHLRSSGNVQQDGALALFARGVFGEFFQERKAVQLKDLPMDSDFAHWVKCSKNRQVLPGSVEMVPKEDKDIPLREKQFLPEGGKADWRKRCECDAEKEQVQGEQEEGGKERSKGVQIGLVLQDCVQGVAAVESPEEAEYAGQERAEGRIDDGEETGKDCDEDQEKDCRNGKEIRSEQSQKGGFRDSDGAGFVCDFEMGNFGTGEKTEEGVSQFVRPDIEPRRNMKREKEDGKQNGPDDERADGCGKGEDGCGFRAEISGDHEQEAQETRIDGDESESQEKQTPAQKP